MLKDVKCASGDVGSLCECEHSEWNSVKRPAEDTSPVEGCSHGDDVGVFCFNSNAGETHACAPGESGIRGVHVGVLHS
jgi:hypothetical protein